MLQLIKLELKKGRLTSYLWGSLIAYIAIAGMMMLIYFVDGANIEEPAFRDYAELLSMIDLLVRATFIVYASVLLSKLIISEFKDKTIALLFAYPVNRKKLIFAKLTMVFVWTFVNVIVANLLIDLIMVGVNTVAGYLSDPLQAELLFNHGLHVLMQAFGAAGMSLLPLVAGLRKKSVPATIVSSIAIVAVVCSNNLGFSLSSIIAVPLSLAALGILITYLSFRQIDRVDVG
ncbi:MAG: ABC transporter permease [Paenibacillus sp.]|uniref:ABC transporter permease n=1 Tax=Paenibacillus sp. TaxID=58172 RepID=UPI0029049271|nr:ABC transporter permease [Paenibacillus sp.]MDU2239324.1 ABC transporter permease [Paenibacillus sp.]